VDKSTESTPFMNENVWKQQNQVMGRAAEKKQAEDYQCQNQNAFRGITLNSVFDYYMGYFEEDSLLACDILCGVVESYSSNLPICVVLMFTVRTVRVVSCTYHDRYF
jgi:hypothetical protein